MRRVMGSCSSLGCWIGELAKGCQLCMKGLKSVVFITGLCKEKCFYCPISLEKRNRDVFFVNEVKVRDLNDVLAEVLACQSRGIGITGGDPILKLDRTISVIKFLKEVLGSDFHTHLYTTGLCLNDDVMNKLVNAGLDELRIHVTGEHSWRALKIALNYSIDVGIENPAIPGYEEALKKIVVRAAELGVKFINLNELEISESNAVSIMLRGLKAKEDGVAVEGSEELAISIIEWVANESIPIGVHYCPARYKDRYQFRLRMLKRAQMTLLPYETIEDGMVKWAVIKKCSEDIIEELISNDLAHRVGSEVVTSLEIAKSLNCEYEIIEAYPLTPRKVLNVLNPESKH